MVYNHWYVYSKYELYEADTFYGDFSFFVSGCVYACGSVKLLKILLGCYFILTTIFFLLIILCRLAKQMAAMALKNSSEMPCTPIASRLAPSSAITPVDWTPGEWSGEESENSQDGDEIEGEELLITTYNEAMASLSEKTKIGKVSPS